MSRARLESVRVATRRPPPQENLREAARRAFEEIAAADPEALAGRAGGTLRGRTIELILLGRPVSVDLDRKAVIEEGGAAASDAVAAPVARYLARCGGLGETGGDWLGFADDANARGYLDPFRRGVVAPLLAAFGRRPEDFAQAAALLGGERVPALETPGSAAYRVRVLPRVDLVFVLSPGDDEFPAEGQVLFPRGLFRAFAVDDLVWLAGLAARALRGKHPVKSSVDRSPNPSP